MNWLLLVVAGLLEVGWAVGLKYTEGFTKLWPSVWTLGAMVLSISMLGLAMRDLPVGTAYAVWTGIGAVGTVIVGIYLLGEPATAGRLISIGLILLGIVGLKLSS
ncbi:quaternary ammonium compound efflux SMR transporter SugE [Rheinheimera sp.]|jgi:quaternary ammonium compound-resistance protein SugE|uniref:quaternary ammonium compound efflux SMR transporter SugE n=1 Tax=Rheinheimera sp. TaxID=1869214 RepID=UPI0026159289|nr:quaternary ammonium compound efflux SMR transporter SugE [Rheinheimera sp.]MCA1928578.1 quaternary ammonium compound efflux SMR transporter SugE [Rheinheimera sp.]